MAKSTGQRSLLEIERDRLNNALSHLERSVQELQAVLIEQGPDPDYKQVHDVKKPWWAARRMATGLMPDECTRRQWMKTWL